MITNSLHKLCMLISEGGTNEKAIEEAILEELHVELNKSKAIKAIPETTAYGKKNRLQ
jgi:hypothetical protein